MRPLAFAILTLALAAVVWKHDRLKHVAVPVLKRPAELPPAAPRELGETAAVKLEPIAKLGTRVTALLTASDGTVWAGTFDRGVFRGEQQLEGNGRQQFVNALVEHGGQVWAATYGGVLEYDLDGGYRGEQLMGLATEALVVHRGELVAGTVRGVFRAFRPEGRALRVTSLAVNGDALWVGTPSGVYEAAGAWHPLVFGPEASSTNVVLALAPFGGGVLALTDNGGLVDVQPGREVRALRFNEPRANEGNPGAALVLGDVVRFGTQGGGLLEVRGGEVVRPKGWSVPVVTALAPGLLGDGAGNVYRL
ncbi:MAG: hypothetical protein JNK82_39025 [Myxococcaceae bacterium]|nr:hypothetical protein [Myxococcaceae bacterium]